ncbi:MAG: helicase-associated domain-containing protein [Spirochaetaceae bacterium]|jgi:hypothetical protein|nr:helicase-associated domain-containing protein [Spirochaetaceae bacterium]
MTLPDNTFFELMRSVLGTIKTPFNKQTLLEELSRFVANPEIQETMAAYIDGSDRRIIAAVALLGEPEPGELESIFTGEFSYTELQGMLLNLEERLILYRFRDQGKLHLALNPRLEQILAPAAADTPVLFPSVPMEEAAPPDTMNDRTLAALCGFLTGKEVLRAEESEGPLLRRKVLEEGNRLFPGLDLEKIAGGCITLGLFKPRKESLEWEEPQLEAFKAIPSRLRFEYLAAGIALFLRRGLAFPGRGILKNTARLIHALVSRTEGSAGLFPETTMIKFVEILRREEEQSWGFAGELPASSLLLQALVMAGLFIPVKRGDTSLYFPVRYAEHTPADPRIVMDSGFSFILYPEISFADAVDLAAFSDLEERGTTVRFVLSRESVVRGFDRGYTAERIWGLLKRLSGDRAEDALKWNLDDWEKRYREVSLVRGLVLILEGDRSYLAQTGPIAAMITRTLAPGVYLLSADEEEAAAALRGAGVDIVARPRGGSALVSGAFPPLGSPEIPAGLEVPPNREGAADQDAPDKAEQIKAKFRDILRGMKMSREEQEEMEGRIERRVVVSEKQLLDTSLRYEKLEARSLDYVGKTGIARGAIASGSILELTWTIPGSGEQKVLGVPESLEKKGGEMILVMRPREGGEPLRIPLGKISLLRRIKQSIFGE